MVAAMADAGFVVKFSNVRTVGQQIFATVADRDFMVRAVDAEGDHAPSSLERVLAHSARARPTAGCTQRRHYFYDSDPVGMAYFIASAETEDRNGPQPMNASRSEPRHRHSSGSGYQPMSRQRPG